MKSHRIPSFFFFARKIFPIEDRLYVNVLYKIASIYSCYLYLFDFSELAATRESEPLPKPLQMD